MTESYVNLAVQRERERERERDGGSKEKSRECTQGCHFVSLALSHLIPPSSQECFPQAHTHSHG